MNAPANRQIVLMGSCYALGTFADNFYKQAAVLMAAAAGMTGAQGMATVLFSLPFVLFSAWAGWLSDKAPKKYIVIAAKLLELAAMLAGGLMLLTANWTGILAVMFVMAAQSTLFSPAINGSIPEIFPARAVPRVNALIKLASTAAILAGMALAGAVLDFRPGGLGGLLPSFSTACDGEAYGRTAAALVLAVVSCAGILTALLLRTIPASRNGTSPFPWTGPLDSIRHTLACRKDPSLFLVLMADAWFYGISVVTVISIANLTTALGHSNTVAGLMSALLMTGVALGSLIAGRHSAESWKRLLLPSALGISGLLALCALTPLLPPTARLWWLGACLLLCGLCGGMYLIPLESYIQVRPAPAEKGKIIAASNFASFTAMAVFGALFIPVSLLPPALTFAVFGLATACFMLLWTGPAMRRLPGRSLKDAASNVVGLLAKALLSLRYRITEDGLDALPAPINSHYAEDGLALCGLCPHPPGTGRPWTRQMSPKGHSEHCRPVPAGAIPIESTDTADVTEGIYATYASNEKKRPGILFLPNHPALIDPAIVYSRLLGLAPRALADHSQMRGLPQRIAGRLAGVITIPDLSPENAGPPRRNAPADRNGASPLSGAEKRRADAANVRNAIAALADALRRGENVMLYPSGRVYRNGLEHIGNNSAAARLLEAVPDARVVLVRTTGLWGSSFSRASGGRPAFVNRLMRGIATLLGNAFFFTPRRDLRMTFTEPGDLADILKNAGGRAAFNRRLEGFYNEGGEETPRSVPRFFWQRGAS